MSISITWKDEDDEIEAVCNTLIIGMMFSDGYMPDETGVRLSAKTEPSTEPGKDGWWSRTFTIHFDGTWEAAYIDAPIKEQLPSKRMVWEAMKYKIKEWHE